MDFAPRDADPWATTLVVDDLLHCPDISLSPIASSRADRPDQKYKKRPPQARSLYSVVTGLIQASHVSPQQQQHGETPGLIFFLYEWLTCVCKVLYLTKGKGRETSGEGYSSLFASFWLTRGLGRYLYPAQALR